MGRTGSWGNEITKLSSFGLLVGGGGSASSPSSDPSRCFCRKPIARMPVWATMSVMEPAAPRTGSCSNDISTALPVDASPLPRRPTERPALPSAPSLSSNERPVAREPTAGVESMRESAGGDCEPLGEAPSTSRFILLAAIVLERATTGRPLGVSISLLPSVRAMRRTSEPRKLSRSKRRLLAGRLPRWRRNITHRNRARTGVRASPRDARRLSETPAERSRL